MFWQRTSQDECASTVLYVPHDAHRRPVAREVVVAGARVVCVFGVRWCGHLFEDGAGLSDSNDLAAL